jgi:hypothetical protein
MMGMQTQHMLLTVYARKTLNASGTWTVLTLARWTSLPGQIRRQSVEGSKEWDSDVALAVKLLSQELPTELWMEPVSPASLGVIHTRLIANPASITAAPLR